MNYSRTYLPSAVSFPPALSADPVVASAAKRFQAISAEMDRLQSSLVAYAERNVMPSMPLPERTPVSPMEHYYMLDESDHGCGCSVCADWETRRAEFVTAVKIIPKGHKWGTCNCSDCRLVGRFQVNYLAAMNKRDLTIEMSFHANYHSPHGELVMAWLEEELKKPGYTVNWCAQEMNRYPVERWVQRCEMAVSGRVSGAVFCTSTMNTGMHVSLGSSLMAEATVEMGEERR